MAVSLLRLNYKGLEIFVQRSLFFFVRFEISFCVLCGSQVLELDMVNYCYFCRKM
jgi:hypothetical protein